MITYVVTGLERTGTSMMMRAISESSNLEVVRDLGREALIADEMIDPLYHPNPNGYYIPPHDVLPHHMPGKLIKCNAVPLSYIPVDTEFYLVILMTRDEEKRRISYERGFGEVDDYYVEYSTECIDAFKKRPDVSIITIRYEEIVNDPLPIFDQLVEAGWPIDAEKAAQLVDRELYRNR